MFFGILLFIIGIGLILPKLPVFNIILGICFILLGISFFTGKSFHQYLNFSKETITIFGKQEMKYNSKEKKYITIFGNSKLDLNPVQLDDKKEVKVISLFANSNLYLNKNSNFKIKATTLFGATNLPSKTTEGFGEVDSKSSSFDETKSYFDIEIISLFGNTHVSYEGAGADAFWTIF